MRELASFSLRLKLEACPHCRQTGFLNKHDHIRGNGEDTNRKRSVTKGRRVYCSNRNRRGGCGRTFMLLAAGFIHHHTIATPNLWRFLKAMADGSTAFGAFAAGLIPFSLSTLYRLLKQASLSQPSIRSRLLCLVPPADRNDATPLAQTLLHLETCFPGAGDPLHAYQARFQTSIL